MNGKLFSKAIVFQNKSDEMNPLKLSYQVFVAKIYCRICLITYKNLSSHVPHVKDALLCLSIWMANVWALSVFFDLSTFLQISHMYWNYQISITGLKVTKIWYLIKACFYNPFKSTLLNVMKWWTVIVFLLSEGSKWKLKRLYPGFFMPLKTLFCCFLHMIMYGLKSIKK